MKRAYRAQQVVIDVPKPGAIPFVSILIQHLEVDETGKVLAQTAREDRIYKKTSDIFAQTITFTDPVTGTTGQVSIAGLDQIVRKFTNDWTQEKYGGSIGPSGFIEVD